MKRKDNSFWTLWFVLFLIASCSNKSRLADECFQKGQAFEKANQPDSALVRYRAALDAQPKHVKAGMAYQDLAISRFGADDEVWNRYEALAKKHLGDPIFQLLFNRLLENRDEQIERDLRIVERHPRLFWGHYLLADAYQNYRDRDYSQEAKEALEKAVKINPSQIDVYDQLVRLSYRMDDFVKMNTYFQEALAMDSTRIDLYSFLWRSEYRLAANKDSIKTVLKNKTDAMLVRHGRDPKFLRSIWGILEEVDQKHAADLGRELEALDPQGPEAQGNMMDPLWSEKNPKKGFAGAQAFLKKYPKHDYTSNAFYLWLRFAEQLPSVRDVEVDAFAQQLIAQNGNKNNFYSTLYNYYSKKYPSDYGRQERLVRQWVEALGQRRRSPALSTLGRLYIKQNRLDEALKILLEGDSLSRRYSNPSADVCQSLGEIYQIKGDFDRALDCFSQSIGLRDNDSTVEKFYAAYEKKFGSREGVRKYLNQKILAVSALKKPFPAPDFTLTTVTGDTIRFSGFRGKAVLVSIWNPG